jgi:hypothetical protein
MNMLWVPTNTLFQSISVSWQWWTCRMNIMSHTCLYCFNTAASTSRHNNVSSAGPNLTDHVCRNAWRGVLHQCHKAVIKMFTQQLFRVAVVALLTPPHTTQPCTCSINSVCNTNHTSVYMYGCWGLCTIGLRPTSKCTHSHQSSDLIRFRM